MTEDTDARSPRIRTASRSTRSSWISRRRTRCSGSTTSIFRPHNVYGEHQNIGDRYRNVIGIFMNQIMQGEPMTIFGDGSQTRAFSTSTTSRR